MLSPRRRPRSLMTSSRAGALLRWVVAAALVGLPAVAAALRMGPMGFLGIDDANIYFVYAKNLALGHGFVYHPGGERVEGFTSLLWTLLCAAAHRVAARPEPWLIGLNAVVMGGALARGAGFAD